HGEGGRVYANSQGQRKHSGRCEAWILPQHAQAEAQVLEKAVDETYTSRIAAFFFRAFDAAKLDARAPQCLRARHAAASQVFRECLDVKAQLRVHLPFHPRTAESCLQPRPKPAPKRHTSSGLVPKIPAMTSAMRFQFSASACSLRFPAAVSR